MTNSRDKGKRGEREFAAAFTRATGIAARRGVQHAGGPESPDVVTGLEGVHIEVKRTEQLRLREAQLQAERDAAGKVPVVAHRYSRGEWWLMVPLDRIEDFVGAMVFGTEAEKKGSEKT